MKLPYRLLTCLLPCLLAWCLVFSQTQPGTLQTHVHEEEEERLSFSEGFAMKLLNNRWNFVDASGKLLSDVKYEAVRNFVNGMAAVQMDFKWGFIDRNGALVIPCIYDIVHDFTSPNTAVFLSGKWIIINKKGDHLAFPEIDISWGFENGKSVVSKNERKGLMDQQGRIIEWTENEISVSKPPAIARTANPMAACPPNIDFENGNFTNWQCYTGRVDTNRQNNIITLTPSAPVNNRHTLIPRGSLLDQYGLFPLSAPDGSNYVVKLGNNLSGAGAERISYVINVPQNATDYSITFQYAVVFQDPGHTQWAQPRFQAKMYDPSTNTYLDCATFEYIATSSLPGFSNSGIYRYKPWSSVFINLSDYGGKSLILEFTTADCTRGAHWGYAYIDVGNCNRVASISAECAPPHITTLTGPGGFQSYNWWDSAFTTIIGTGENFVVNPGPTTQTHYWVEVIPFNGYGCRDTLHVSITPNYPVAKAGADKSICRTRSTTIGTDSLPGFTYSWSPSIYLSASNVSSPTVTPLATTTYTLTVTNILTGCTSTDVVTVTFNPQPVVAFTTSQPNQCIATNRYTFSNTSSVSSGALTQLWDFGDNTYSTDLSPSHTYSSPGTYTVKLVCTSDGGCSDSTTRQVIVYPSPVAGFSVSADAQCLRGNSFSFSNTSPAGQVISGFVWSFGDGAVSSTANTVHSYSTSGNYVAKLIITNDKGCQDSMIKNIVVYATPNVVISSANPFVCRGKNIQLQASGANSYAWTPSQGLSCNNCPGPVALIDSTSAFMVKGTDVNGCYAEDTISIRVYQPLKLAVVNDSICLNRNTMLQASGASLYQWSPPTGLSNASSSNPMADPALTTVYKVVGSDSVGCFSDSAYVTILVQERPTIELGPDLNLQTGTVVTLQSQIQNGPIVQWLWSPVTNLSCGNCPAPVTTVKGDATYHVSVTNKYGCVARDIITIKTFCKNSQVFIPNAFTPDGDGDNDILMVRASGITMVKSFRVFNRWGELVFEKTHFPANSPAYGWDGKVRGIPGEPVVYVYTAEVVCDNGAVFTYKGNTTILK